MAKQFLDLRLEYGKSNPHCSPDRFIINLFTVPVCESMAESYDGSVICDPLRGIDVHTVYSAECFTDDGQVPFDRLSHTSIGFIVSE
jgi:hypothetical protein